MESEDIKKRFLLFNTISNKLDHVYSYDEKNFNEIKNLLDSYMHEYKEPDCCLIKKFYLIKNGIKESMKKHR
ncbi:hypothetical protein [Tepidibacter aestuarii]|uniref:hypothetical protein n=1 Tax=Tepidibacter aestuarii TaxID=2925782 RepID=UPI0020BF5179|nr:hypothetical protein [Tepidibacter aestuarii]CAH2213658.1 putative anti repressor, phage associated protein [Tepidibacter aestuarii]CAH2215664.1 putative anti repressor, phage associated protein [Tepidibacter aestuarii]